MYPPLSIGTVTCTIRVELVDDDCSSLPARTYKLRLSRLLTQGRALDPAIPTGALVVYVDRAMSLFVYRKYCHRRRGLKLRLEGLLDLRHGMSRFSHQSLRRFAWAAGAASLLVLTGLSWLHQRSESARLLKAWPDAIPSNAQLNAWAMARGRRAFGRYCARCHGDAGEPDPSRGVPDLRDREWLYGSGRVDEIERVVLYGIRSGNSKGWDLASMPAFATANPYARYATPSLSPNELTDVTEYLYSLQHSDADASAAARGIRLFENTSRGLCWDCHGGLGQGDASIGAPNLRDRIWLYGDGSRASIYASIAHGRAGICPAWSGHISPATALAVAVYTHSLSQHPPRQSPPVARNE